MLQYINIVLINIVAVVAIMRRSSCCSVYYAHVRATEDHAILSLEGLKILTTWRRQDPEY